jgi:hypothetical protein
VAGAGRGDSAASCLEPLDRLARVAVELRLAFEVPRHLLDAAGQRADRRQRTRLLVVERLPSTSTR